MAEITTDALVEAMARALQDARWPNQPPNTWDSLPPSIQEWRRHNARAALAALVKAAGDRLGECSRDPLCPRVAAFLRALAGAADG